MMNFAPARRSIGCLKTVFRQTRQQRLAQRGLATAVDAPTTSKDTFTERQRASHAKIEKFQVWPQIPSVRSTNPDPMPILRQQQIAALDPTGARTRLFSKDHADSAKVGDVLMVTTKTGEPFSGAFIQIRRRGVDTAILLRGQMMKTGVEMWFKVYSPTVTGIDIIWRRPKRARRARLTYMRKPKHDMGSVDHLVSAWKKERYALRSKSKQAVGGKGRK
ncbi:hypothetical protein E4U43_008612 [Claviceps pusilla]|uniref:Ribosomal protein L19, mitochondrial n=1 Tax=Claviceps pusilla TaxID=123648 RepID=A0A9P7NCW3_9HYPO|nr:hypothetical protein E4U43_008612 [Claviceps pusilla]